ncbi:TPA: DUF1351 domain-containing protein [Streptococcus agalactiae]|uniref:DUF1351 domain-containing protein n=1 Tax=Streptococcus anginosus TaxID=1328 RepID=UPI00189B82A5|nr:DUF1351 domain-containing protein [Streptococcus anginosus]MDB8660528.1 DUF1351 domain-containing protein [Streptococcus anginosus]HEQ0291653.1 DUF1351 domain-containing protein [Streptococcus pyogenes]HES7273729.1 DUF1351 domain-containing protein [Streptococcus pyogenes]
MTEELKDVTDSLELVPVSELQVGFNLKAAEIEIQGKEVLEQALAAYQKKYAGYIVTEETLSDDTKVKDELGRVQRQIEQELKEQLKDYSKPLDEAKAWVNSILDPIKTLQADIKNQIKEFEERATEARKETVKEAFKAAIAESEIDLDIKLFAIYFDDFSKKKCFMADNVRINQATSKMIVDLVAEEVVKKQQRESGLIQITEAAAKAGFGPAIYIREYEGGAKLADILQAILDDKELADRTKAEAKLKQRIEEMAAIAEDKGLNPEKYVDLLNEGRSALDVINILHADADELRQAQAEAEQNTQNQSYAQNQSEFKRETVSEGNYTSEQETGQKSQNMASDDVTKKYGYRYQNMEIIFPEKDMRLVKEKFKTLSQELGIVVRVMPGMESKAERVEMK